jgi:hypothetical protein
VHEADKVALVEQIHLQGAGLGEPSDGAALRCGDPVDAVHRGHRLDLLHGSDDRFAIVRFLTRSPSRTLSRSKYAGQEFRLGTVSMCMAQNNMICSTHR